jgi:hypothetical protein
VVESRLHHCLDITLREDQSRVRTPSAARVLGTLRRVVVSLANAAVNRARQNNPKTKCNTGTFQKRLRSARGGRERLQALIFAKSPDVLSLAPVQKLIQVFAWEQGVVPIRKHAMSL